MEWLRDRIRPISIIVGSLTIGGLVWWFGFRLIGLVDPAIAATPSPTYTVNGSDIVADLLTISALTISVCIAYICLPRDRVEVRFATLVKMNLEKKLIDFSYFSSYVGQLHPDDKTPSCKFICGMLEPLHGVGGWHKFSQADMEEFFGRPAWQSLKRFVDQHLDEQYLRILIYGLCICMSLGFLDLFDRYFGTVSTHYNSFELGVIASLLLMNIGTGFILIILASGTHSSEAHFLSRMVTSIDEVKPGYTTWLKARRDTKTGEVDQRIDNATQTTSTAR